MIGKDYQHYLKQLQLGADDLLAIDGLVDIANRASEQHRICFSYFVHPQYAVLTQTIVGQQMTCLAFGGYSDAEYQVLGFAPKGYTIDHGDFPIAALRFHYRSSFGTLSHRQVLGTLLSMGIERHLLGDICLTEQSADVVVVDHIVDYLAEGITKIAKLGVRAERIPIDCLGFVNRDLPTRSVNASSLRLDNVMAALYRLSRGKAQTYLKAKRVKLNYLPTTDISQRVNPGDLISLRGVGRCYIDHITTTKKGRYRLVVRQTAR